MLVSLTDKLGATFGMACVITKSCGEKRGSDGRGVATVRDDTVEGAKAPKIGR